MTEKQSVMPVTKDQAVQTNIGYASKIGKQVIKSQLKAKLDELKAKRESISDEAMNVFDVKDLEKYLNDKVTLGIKHDGDVTRFRNLCNTFSPHHDEHNFASNLNFVDSIASGSAARSLQMCSLESPQFKKVLEELGTDVNVDFKVRWAGEGYEDLLGFSCFVALDDVWMAKLKEQAALVSEERKIYDDICAINKKMDDIDQLVEEMEAKLLVDELSSSAEGKKVLAVTSELVSGVLDMTPELLALEK